jgi:hypothetical protein
VASTATRAPYRPGTAGWWFHAKDGRLAVAQLPNPALWVWLAAVLAGLFDLPADDARTVEGIRHGALILWAVDEVARGASPFRRVLGLVVLAVQLVALFS